MAKPRIPELNSSSPQAAGLLSWWPFAEDGTRIFDYFNRSSGAATQSARVTGGRGIYIPASTSNSYFQVTAIPQIASVAQLSFCLWGKPIALPGTNTIYSLGATLTDNLGFLSGSGGGAAADVRIAIGSANYGTFTSAFTAYKPFFLCAVYDGGATGNSNRLKLYIDGLVKTLTFTGTIPATTPATPGDLKFGNTSISPGYISEYHEFRIYNRLLSPAEIFEMQQDRFDLYAVPKKAIFIPTAAKIQSLTDPLTINQTATTATTYSRPVSTALTITDTVTAGGGTKNLTANNTITFSDLADSNFIPLIVNDTINLGQNVNTPLILTQAITDTLTINQTVKTDPSYQSVTDVLTFTDLARSGTINIRITDTIVFDSNVGSIRRFSLTDTLVLTDSFSDRDRFFESLILSQNVHVTQTLYISLGHNIVFTDDFKQHGVIRIDVEDGLNLTDSAKTKYNLHYTITDVLNITDIGSRTFEVSASNALVFVDIVSIIEHGTLVLGQSVDANVSKSGHDTLTITDSVSLKQDLVRAITDPIVFVSNVTGYVVRLPGAPAPPSGYIPPQKAYRPIGSGSFTVEPTIIPVTSITLTYPYVSPTRTIELRSPIFGDTDAMERNRVLARSRVGTLNVFRKNEWPKSRKLTWTIKALKRTEIDALIEFQGNCFGQEIGLLDFESRQWRGLFEINDIKQSGKGCNYTLEMTFDGVLA